MIFDDFDNQVLEVGKTLSFVERRELFRLVRAWKRLHTPTIAHLLESKYGLSIDADNAADGSDQDYEKGEPIN